MFVRSRVNVYRGIVGRSYDRRADKERAINSANTPGMYRGNESARPCVVRSQYFSLSRDRSATYAWRKRTKADRAGGRGGGWREAAAKGRRHRAEARILVATPSRNY